VERSELSDRQFEAVLDRLDQLVGEVRALNRRLDRGEELQKIVRELASLSESLQTLAYAALGQASPQVRRRRTG
jgi:DNA-binding FrmR family transcriptional regulator